MQLAVSCCELYFARCWCAVKRTGTSASESKVMSYLTLRSDVLIFRFPNINQCVKNFLPLRKVKFIKWINSWVEFIKWINLINVFCLVSLDCGLLENFFWVISEERNGFSFLFPARLCFSLANKPLRAAGMSADNVRGWGIVREMNIWPRSEASRANMKFWGPSLSPIISQHTTKPERGLFIL